MKRILIGINNLTQVGQPEYGNHIQLFYRLGRNMTEYDFILCNPRRMSIDRMRNFAAAAAMEAGCEFLVFIDDDVLVPFDAIQRLVAWAKEGFDVVAGVTHIRSYPFHPMIFDFSNKENHYVDDYATKAGSSGLLACDAVGFSLCLIRVELLKKMVPPFFVTGNTFTEDVFFCQRAKNQFPDVKIGVDTLIHTAHELSPSFITPANVEQYRLFEETLDPSLVVKNKRDRAIDYFQNIGALEEDDSDPYPVEPDFGVNDVKN